MTDLMPMFRLRQRYLKVAPFSFVEDKSAMAMHR
jgi:hypothetical protein